VSQGTGPEFKPRNSKKKKKKKKENIKNHPRKNYALATEGCWFK
jgi:hypothetical protein